MKDDITIKKHGPWFALAALLAMLLVVAYIAYLGHPTSAATLGGGVIIGVVALFLGQRWKPGGFDKSDGEDDA